MGEKVVDGKYTGELSAVEVIEQFEYRIGIHETYAGLVLDDPDRWSAFGTYEFHMWAINGYEWGIKYIHENNQVEYRCNVSEAFSTLFKALKKLFVR